MKFQSGGYAPHQIVLIRSLVGMTAVLLFMLPFQGGLAALKPRRLGEKMTWAGMAFLANMTVFLGLAALPLADAVAVGAGLVGILIILRSGTSSFKLASLLPIAAAFGLLTYIL